MSAGQGHADGETQPGDHLDRRGEPEHLDELGAGSALLHVDDLDEALSVLAADDITPDRISEIDGICRQAFLTDPAGNQVELNQPL